MMSKSELTSPPAKPSDQSVAVFDLAPDDGGSPVQFQATLSRAVELMKSFPDRYRLVQAGETEPTERSDCKPNNPNGRPMRKIPAALLLAALLLKIFVAPAAAQPPPVPALPDTERRTSYSLSSSTCSCSVGFQLYGDSTDYGNWLDVKLTTGSGATAVTTTLTAVTDYTITSPTGALATIPRPITDGVLTLTVARTGTMQIVGAQRPRRLSQFSENRGVAARDLNQAFTGALAIMRETWDRTNDITGRALLTNPGETVGPLPSVAARAGGILAFNSNGDPIAQSALTGLGNVVGPNVSTVGHIATFGNSAGTILLDGGLIGAGNVVGPGSATDGAIALFNGTGGTTIKNGPAGTTTTLLHGNAAGIPSYSAVSLTADVSGLLPLANGGTNASLTASLGGIPYSTASAFAILSGTATASLPLLSGSSAAPTWAAVAYPASATSGGVPYFSSTSVMASSALLAANQIMVGGGAGAAPTTFACATTTTVVHGGTPPSCAQVGLTTDVTGTLPFSNGGFGISTATSGGIPYFSGTGSVASSALLTANALMLGGGAGATPSTPVSLGTTTTVLHGNAAGVPSFGAVALSTDVSGTLPVANGGTGLTSGTSGGIPAYTASGTLASSPALTANALIVGGGAGATPSALASLGSATTVLHGNGSGVPSFGAVALTSDVTGSLPIANGGTGQATAALARTASGLNIDAVTTFGNANYTALITDRVIATTSGFSAPRTVTLPLVSSFNAGQTLVVIDSAGAINGANTMAIAANAADSINGSASITISSQYSGAVLWPIGSNKWGYIASSAGGGSGTVTGVTAGAGLSTGSGSSTISTSGTLYSITAPQGRLTLVQNTPVMNSAQTAKATIYYDCYVGNVVPYYNGTTDAADTIPSCDVSLTMVSAASTGQVTASGVFDVWWVHSGANRICVATSAGAGGGGGGWASDTGGSNTARGTGFSQLDYTSRPYVTNKNAIANCYNGATNYGSVSANQATYLGTVYSTAAGQTSQYIGVTSGAGGGNPILGLFNGYNQVPTACINEDSTATWTYASTTARKSDNSASNRCSWVDGLQRSPVGVGFGQSATNVPGIGFVLDAAGTTMDFINYSTSTVGVGLYATGAYTPQIGFHFIQQMEVSTSGGQTTTFAGGTFNSGSVMTMTVQLNM